MSWLIGWGVLSVGVIVGFFLAALLDSGDLEYVSGGFMVQDVGHGVVIIKGDLSLRVAEDE